MAYVPENQRYNTDYGKLKNNNTANQIQRNNVPLFNFSISEVTVEDGDLTVVCDTITGDTETITVTLGEDKAELSTLLYNYSTGGTLPMFLSVVWRLYLSTLDEEGVQVDAESLESLRDTIAELEAQVADLEAQLAEATASNDDDDDDAGGETTPDNNGGE